MNELLRRSRIIIADGGMGTELHNAGLEPGTSGELWNLDNPEAVLAIQRACVDAGAEVLLTNTFGASSIALARHDLQHRVVEINQAAVQIAFQAADESAWVLGDIGPFGGFMEPLGDTPREQVHCSFVQQAATLLGAGVDGIIIETMGALDELEVAIAAAREAGARLIVGSVTFEKTRAGIRTMTGATPQQVAAALTSHEVDIIGTNCGTALNTADYAEIVRGYRTVNSRVPVLVKMNAGSPRLVGERTVFDTSAQIFAHALAPLIDAGADIIGGCCGTSAQHIAALAAALP